MKKIITLLFFFTMCFFNTYAQKELWGVNSGEELDFSGNPGYKGNITKYDINGENPAIMHEFDSIHGYRPKGRLFLASNGKIYGTTLKGGNSILIGEGLYASAGILFEYDLIFNSYRVVHYFDFDINGNVPAIGVLEPIPGQLYGATNNRIYKYDIATETMTFYNSLPYNNHIGFELMKASDGNLYGTSYDNICPNQFSTTFNNGCVIKFNMTTNVLSVVHPLNCDINSEGASPWCALVETSPGKLIGTTLTGGFSQIEADGLLFEYNFITNTYTSKIYFTNLNPGQRSNTLVNGGDGKIYGLCEYGGVTQECNPNFHFGTLYEYTPATNITEVKQNFSFCGNTVRYPTSLMKTSMGHYVGTIPNLGLFRWYADTNTIVMPDYSNVICPCPNLDNVANLIEICRKPSYRFFDVNTFDGCVGGTFSYNIQNTNATSYQWQKNNINVAGQTTGILNLTNLTTGDAGAYTCVMTNECGTTTTMVLNLTVNCLGTNTVATLDKAIKLYPNPTKNSLNIKLPENIEVNVTGISIANSLGQMVLEQKSLNTTGIDVSHLQAGIYFISLNTNYGNWQGKFIKE